MGKKEKIGLLLFILNLLVFMQMYNHPTSIPSWTFFAQAVFWGLVFIFSKPDISKDHTHV